MTRVFRPCEGGLSERPARFIMSGDVVARNNAEYRCGNANVLFTDQIFSALSRPSSKESEQSSSRIETRAVAVAATISHSWHLLDVSRSNVRHSRLIHNSLCNDNRLRNDSPPDRLFDQMQEPLCHIRVFLLPFRIEYILKSA